MALELSEPVCKLFRARSGCAKGLAWSEESATGPRAGSTVCGVLSGPPSASVGNGRLRVSLNWIASAGGLFTAVSGSGTALAVACSLVSSAWRPHMLEAFAARRRTSADDGTSVPFPIVKGTMPLTDQLSGISAHCKAGTWPSRKIASQGPSQLLVLFTIRKAQAPRVSGARFQNPNLRLLPAPRIDFISSVRARTWHAGTLTTFRQLGQNLFLKCAVQGGHTTHSCVSLIDSFPPPPAPRDGLTLASLEARGANLFAIGAQEQ